MAEKRMISEAIMNMGQFVKLPWDIQMLYIRLNLCADDDGFVDSPVVACRIVGTDETAVQLLQKQGFLICFPDGPVVITHWHVQNVIRKDRYKPTLFTQYLQQLQVNEAGVYVLQKPEAVPAAAEQPLPQQPATGEQQVLELYHRLCPSLTPCMGMDGRTSRLVQEGLARWGLARYEQLFRSAEQTPYLTGQGKDGWRASFTWLVRPENMEKVLSDHFADWRATVPTGGHRLGQAELDAIRQALEDEP